MVCSGLPTNSAVDGDKLVCGIYHVIETEIAVDERVALISAIDVEDNRILKDVNSRSRAS